jgi:hypothetical protein
VQASPSEPSSDWQILSRHHYPASCLGKQIKPCAGGSICTHVAGAELVGARRAVRAKHRHAGAAV